MAKGSGQIVAERSKDCSFCVGSVPQRYLRSPPLSMSRVYHALAMGFTLKNVAAAIYAAGTAMISQSRATRIPSRPSKG